VKIRNSVSIDKECYVTGFLKTVDVKKTVMNVADESDVNTEEEVQN
jgi:hypothetical protein